MDEWLDKQIDLKGSVELQDEWAIAGHLGFPWKHVSWTIGFALVYM